MGAQAWTGGVARAIAGARVAREVALVVFAYFVYFLARGFTDWVKKHRVDCVLTLSTFRNEPNHMREWLAAEGMNCPRDIGLVSLDVTGAAAAWAGIDQNSDEIGKAAVDLLLSKVRAGERGIPKVRRSLLVHCQWSEGGTVRAAAGEKACA